MSVFMTILLSHWTLIFVVEMVLSNDIRIKIIATINFTFAILCSPMV